MSASVVIRDEHLLDRINAERLRRKSATLTKTARELIQERLFTLQMEAARPSAPPLEVPRKKSA